MGAVYLCCGVHVCGVEEEDDGRAGVLLGNSVPTTQVGNTVIYPNTRQYLGTKNKKSKSQCWVLLPSSTGTGPDNM